MKILSQNWFYLVERVEMMLLEFHLRDFGLNIDFICHKHGGTQKIMIQDDGNSLVILLDLVGFMIHF
jgi:hypothetical protein